MRSIRATRDRAPALLALAAGAVLAWPLGCTRGLHAPIAGAGGEDAPPRQGGTLHLASSNDIRNLDPAGPLDGLAMQVVPLLFDGLVDFDRHARLVPDLADHYDVEDGGRTVRFDLPVEAIRVWPQSDERPWSI